MESAGIAVEDLRLISAGFGVPVQWEMMRTCVRVSAADESVARAAIALTLGVNMADLRTYSAEIFT